MDGSLAIKEVRLSIKSFDNNDMVALLGDLVVGRTLREFPDFDCAGSFAIFVHAIAESGINQTLHRACAYRFAGFAVQADAWSADLARRAGFHHPCLARRVMYCAQVDGLSPENILVLPQLGPDWTHKMQDFGFDQTTCAIRRALPAAIRDLKQPVFNLSAEGLKRMRDSASTAFQLQTKRFQDVPMIDETYLGRADVQQALRGGARIFRFRNLIG
jgi:hypothetical protein